MKTIEELSQEIVKEKTDILIKAMNVPDSPLVMEQIKDYLNSLANIYLELETRKLLRDDIMLMERDQNETREKILNGVVERFKEEREKVNKGEPVNFVEMALTSYILDDILSSASLEEARLELTDFLNRSKEEKHIDEKVDFLITEENDGFKVMIEYDNEPVLMKYEIDGTFTLAFALYHLKEDNVIFVKDVREDMYENVEKVTETQKYSN